MVTGLKRTKTADKVETLKKSRKKQYNHRSASSSLVPSGTINSGKESGSKDEDDVQEWENCDHTISDETKSSSFHLHLNHILTNDEMNKLEKKTWKFRSEMPEIGMSMAKWVETLKKSRKKQYTHRSASSSLVTSGTINSGKESGSRDEDDGHEWENCDHTISDETKSSSFHLHMNHILTNDEMNKLEKKTWKFRSEMPEIGMSMAKWVGTGDHILEEATSDSFYGIKQKLYKHWSDICITSGSNNTKLSKQRHFFSLCSSYQDILHCSKKPFYQGGSEDSGVMDAYIMHALNHVYHTRDIVTKNDSQLKKHEESKEEEYLCGGSVLNRGFTRPKVMLLLPLRSIALRVVKRLIELTPLTNKANVDHIGRFYEEFGSDDVEDEEEEDKSSKAEKPRKPADFQSLFGGNNDDHFMIGIKFTKRSIKLYSDFYSSDIIVASPVALACKIAEAGEEKEKDVDYLSSIEILVIDHADVIAMQNWSHVDAVVTQLNHIPSKQHGTDVMRIRQWYLDGHARYYRQTILLGSFLNPDMNALFNQFCVNYKGKVKLVQEFKGVLPKVLLQVRQVYERFDATSIGNEDDARLEYFSKKVFPKIKDSIGGGIMLFISSYFEFVRVRNFLKSQNASFCLLGEYTKQSDVSRARVWFFEGTRKIMLYTERAYFHHRYKIRGITNLIVYSLPERMEFYPEIINMFDGSADMACRVIFSRFDYLKLERIVGTASSKRMLSSDKRVFVFC